MKSLIFLPLLLSSCLAELSLEQQESALMIELYTVRTRIRDRDGKACVGGNDCCRPDNQCSLGEGDCDTDQDCQGDLQCNAECDVKDVDVPSRSQNHLPKHVFKTPEFSGSDRCCGLPSRVLRSLKN